MVGDTYLGQLRDLNEPLEVLKVTGAVEQIFQPRDGEEPEGAGVFSSPREEGRVYTPAFLLCLPRPKAQAVKEMAPVSKDSIMML